jgi:hypothetical protein
MSYRRFIAVSRRNRTLRIAVRLGERWFELRAREMPKPPKAVH